MNLLKIFAALTVFAISASMSAQNIPVESVTINVSNKPATSGKLSVGGVRTLVAVVSPANATDKTVTWTSSNPDIITFDKTTAGKIRGFRPGTTVITATAGGVKAEYTVEVSLKDAKVGQYFFSDNTWEASGIVEGKTCVGVIFYLNPDKRSGKIVSLDEAPNLKWSTAAAESPKAESAIDGESNLAKIQAISNWQESFDAEAWCVAKNSGDIRWYLPAVDELRQLFAATCGLTWVESGADESKKEINNWTGNSVTMLPGDNINPYPDERAAFNKYFTNIGATPFTADKYWSSTEFNSEFAQFLSFEGGYSNSQPKQYFHVCRTRAIATFSEKGSTGAVESIGISPTEKSLRIEYSAGASEATVYASSAIRDIAVYSVSGAAVSAKSVAGIYTASVSIENLTPGMYIIVAGTEKGICSGKLMKK